MPTNILFSIVIPTYNYGHVLARAVDSAAGQPGDDYEVIVVNDGSTDNTNEIVKPLLAQFPTKLRYIEKENGGAASARNRGIEESLGRYLIFLDSDDELCEGALEKLRKDLHAHGDISILVGGHIIVFPGGEEKYHSPGDVPKKPSDVFISYLRKGVSVAPGAVAMQREVFSKVSYNEQLKQMEDIPVYGHAFALFHARGLDLPISKMYKHDDSLRNNVELSKIFAFKVADVLFDSSILPPNLMAYKKEFEAMRYLSLFRRLYKGKQYAAARKAYIRCLLVSPVKTLQWRYFSKFIRCLTGGDRALNN